MRSAPAALGFRVKSGWAAAVLISGSADAPCLCVSELINLCDPRDPETRQPYHAAMGELERNKRKLEQRIQAIRSVTGDSIVDLVKRCAEKGFGVRRAGLVVGSVIGDPRSIANPHIRAHVLEGQLFRTALAAALRARGIRSAVFRERDIYAAAAKPHGRSPEQIKRALAALGDSMRPWRSDQKLAALAAWAVL